MVRGGSFTAVDYGCVFKTVVLRKFVQVIMFSLLWWFFWYVDQDMGIVFPFSPAICFSLWFYHRPLFHLLVQHSCGEKNRDMIFPFALFFYGEFQKQDFSTAKMEVVWCLWICILVNFSHVLLKNIWLIFFVVFCKLDQLPKLEQMTPDFVIWLGLAFYRSKVNTVLRLLFFGRLGFKIYVAVAGASKGVFCLLHMIEKWVLYMQSSTSKIFICKCYTCETDGALEHVVGATVWSIWVNNKIETPNGHGSRRLALIRMNWTLDQVCTHYGW